MEAEATADTTSPSTPVTLTVRLIRSFQFRNWKPLVIHNCRLEMSWEEFKKVVDEAVEKSSLPLPFKKNLKFYDTFKLETDPNTNSSKSSNAMINASTPLIRLDEECSKLSLESSKVQNEYDISLFNLSDYQDYVKSLPAS